MLILLNTAHSDEWNDKSVSLKVITIHYRAGVGGCITGIRTRCENRASHYAIMHLSTDPRRCIVSSLRALSDGKWGTIWRLTCRKVTPEGTQKPARPAASQSRPPPTPSLIINKSFLTARLRCPLLVQKGNNGNHLKIKIWNSGYRKSWKCRYPYLINQLRQHLPRATNNTKPGDI